MLLKSFIVCFLHHSSLQVCQWSCHFGSSSIFPLEVCVGLVCCSCCFVFWRSLTSAWLTKAGCKIKASIYLDLCLLHLTNWSQVQQVLAVLSQLVCLLLFCHNANIKFGFFGHNCIHKFCSVIYCALWLFCKGCKVAISNVIFSYCQLEFESISLQDFVVVFFQYVLLLLCAFSNHISVLFCPLKKKKQSSCLTKTLYLLLLVGVQGPRLTLPPAHPFYIGLAQKERKRTIYHIIKCSICNVVKMPSKHDFASLFCKHLCSTVHAFNFSQYLYKRKKEKKGCR